jgi:hypothetical protein
MIRGALTGQRRRCRMWWWCTRPRTTSSALRLAARRATRWAEPQPLNTYPNSIHDVPLALDAKFALWPQMCAVWRAVALSAYRLAHATHMCGFIEILPKAPCRPRTQSRRCMRRRRRWRVRHKQQPRPPTDDAMSACGLAAVHAPVQASDGHL